MDLERMTMTLQHENRQELSDRLESLALKLKLHFEQTQDDGVHEALRALRDTVEGAFEATGNAVNDAAIRADVREVGRLITDGIATAVHRATDDVRDRLDRKA
jgi:hypothetical protein